MRTGRRVTIVLMLVACVALTTAVIAAKDATPSERIKFKKGHDSVVLTGSLAGSEVKRYLVGGEADQKIVLHLSSSNNAARLVLSEFVGTPAAERELARGTDWEGTLPELADYAINVSSDGKDTTYTLRVSVTSSQGR